MGRCVIVEIDVFEVRCLRYTFRCSRLAFGRLSTVITDTFALPIVVALILVIMVDRRRRLARGH